MSSRTSGHILGGEAGEQQGVTLEEANADNTGERFNKGKVFCFAFCSWFLSFVLIQRAKPSRVNSALYPPLGLTLSVLGPPTPTLTTLFSNRMTVLYPSP